MLLVSKKSIEVNSACLSVKLMRYFFPFIVSTGAGPQRSEWISSPILAAHLLTLTFTIPFLSPFAHSQDSQTVALLSSQGQHL